MQSLSYRSSRQWWCMCSMPWHSCPLHAIDGHACGSKAKEVCDNKVVAVKCIFSLSIRAAAIVDGVWGVSGGKEPNINNKRRAQKDRPERPGPTPKRARYTPVTGIPSTFLPAKLAARFQGCVSAANPVGQHGSDRLPTSAVIGIGTSLN